MPYSPPPGLGLAPELRPDRAYEPPESLGVVLQDLPDAEFEAYARADIGQFTAAQTAEVDSAAQAVHSFGVFQNLVSFGLRSDFSTPGQQYVGPPSLLFVFSDGPLVVASQQVLEFTNQAAALADNKASQSKTLQPIAQVTDGDGNPRLLVSTASFAQVTQTNNAYVGGSAVASQTLGTITQVAEGISLPDIRLTVADHVAAAFTQTATGLYIESRRLIADHVFGSGTQTAEGSTAQPPGGRKLRGYYGWGPPPAAPLNPVLVGYKSGSLSGSTATTYNVSLTGLTGGVASSPSPGDVVLIFHGWASSSANYPIEPSGYVFITNYNSPDTRDSNLCASYKIMGDPVDTQVTVPAGGLSAYANACVIFVLRNVRTDATPGYNAWGAIDAARPEFWGSYNNPGDFCVCVGLGTQASTATAAFAHPTEGGQTRWVGPTINVNGSTSDVNIIGGYATTSPWDGVSAGPYNGFATGGTTTTSDSWVSISVTFGKQLQQEDQSDYKVWLDATAGGDIGPKSRAITLRSADSIQPIPAGGPGLILNKTKVFASPVLDEYSARIPLDSYEFPWNTFGNASWTVEWITSDFESNVPGYDKNYVYWGIGAPVDTWSGWFTYSGGQGFSVICAPSFQYNSVTVYYGRHDGSWISANMPGLWAYYTKNWEAEDQKPDLKYSENGATHHILQWDGAGTMYYYNGFRWFSFATDFATIRDQAPWGYVKYLTVFGTGWDQFVVTKGLRYTNVAEAFSPLFTLPKPIPQLGQRMGQFFNDFPRAAVASHTFGQFTNESLVLAIDDTARYLTASGVVAGFTNVTDVVVVPWGNIYASKTFSAFTTSTPATWNLEVTGFFPRIESIAWGYGTDKAAPVAPSVFSGFSNLSWTPVVGGVYLFALNYRCKSDATVVPPSSVGLGGEACTLLHSQVATDGSTKTGFSVWAVTKTNTSSGAVVTWDSTAVHAVVGLLHRVHNVASHNLSGSLVVRLVSNTNLGSAYPGTELFLNEPNQGPYSRSVHYGYRDWPFNYTPYELIYRDENNNAITPAKAFWVGRLFLSSANMHTVHIGQDIVSPFKVKIYGDDYGSFGAVHMELASVTAIPIYSYTVKTMPVYTNEAVVLVGDNIGVVQQNAALPMPLNFWGVFSAPATVTANHSIGTLYNSGSAIGCSQSTTFGLFMNDPVYVNAIAGVNTTKEFGNYPDGYYGEPNNRFQNYNAVHNDESVSRLGRAYRGGTHWVDSQGNLPGTNLLLRFNSLVPDYTQQGTTTYEPMPNWPTQLLDGFGRFKPKSFGLAPGDTKNRYRIRGGDDNGGYSAQARYEIKFWLYLSNAEQEFCLAGLTDASWYFDDYQFIIQHARYKSGHLALMCMGVPLNHGGIESYAYGGLGSSGFPTSNYDHWNNRNDHPEWIGSASSSTLYRSINKLKYGEWNYIELQLGYRMEGPVLWINGQRDLEFAYPRDWYAESTLNAPALKDSEKSTYYEWLDILLRDNAGSGYAAVDEVCVLMSNNTVDTFSIDADPTGYSGEIGKAIPGEATTTNRYLQTIWVPDKPFVHPYGSDGQLLKITQVAVVDTGSDVQYVEQSVTFPVFTNGDGPHVLHVLSAEQDLTLPVITQIARAKQEERIYLEADHVFPVFTQEATLWGEPFRQALQDLTLPPIEQFAMISDPSAPRYAESFKSIPPFTQVGTFRRAVSVRLSRLMDPPYQVATAVLATGFNHFPVLQQVSQTATAILTNLLVADHSFGVYGQTATVTSEQFAVREANQAAMLVPFVTDSTATVTVSAQQSKVFGLITQTATGTAELPVARYAVQTATLPSPEQTATALMVISLTQAKTFGGFQNTATMDSEVAGVQLIAVPDFTQFVPVKVRAVVQAAGQVSEFTNIATAAIGDFVPRFTQAAHTVAGFTQAAQTGVVVGASQSAEIAAYSSGSSKVVVKTAGQSSIGECTNVAEALLLPWPTLDAEQEATVGGFSGDAQAAVQVSAFIDHVVGEFTIIDSQVQAIVQAAADQLLLGVRQTTILGDYKAGGFEYRVRYEGRALEVKAENRTLDIGFEDRLEVIDHEDRTLVVNEGLKNAKV